VGGVWPPRPPPTMWRSKGPWPPAIMPWAIHRRLRPPPPQICWLQCSMGVLAHSSFRLPKMRSARAAHATRAFGSSLHPHVLSPCRYLHVGLHCRLRVCTQRPSPTVTTGPARREQSPRTPGRGQRLPSPFTRSHKRKGPRAIHLWLLAFLSPRCDSSPLRVPTKSQPRYSR
jgi:hypothetical protein